MVNNLYGILEIEKNSDQETIKKSYRKLAMKWHPDKNINNKKYAEQKFKEINKAYDILSNTEKKRQYDLYGTEDIPSVNNFNYSPFKDPDSVFNQFFGENTDFKFFNNFEKEQQSYSPHVFTTTTINMDVLVTLEELYLGTIKKLKITRKIYNNSFSFTKKKEIIKIKIEKGYKEGTKITFKGKGNQLYNMLPGSICFVIKEIKHNLYTRNQDDLIVEKEITLKEALVDYLIELPFLDKTVIREKINDNLVIHPNYKHLIKGRGMPNSKKKKYGNLYINFKIIFPKKLSLYQKKLIKSIL
jgi:DnaJ homolog subfamily B member 4